MSKIIPFKAVRPTPDKVALVSCRNYDDYSATELASWLDFNPYSFLHVVNPAYAHSQKITLEKRFKGVAHKYQDFKNKIPKLIVFDLDSTLWPFNCANDENFNEIKDISWTIINDNVYDNKGKLANCYPDVKEIIGELYDNNINVAYATHNLYKNHVTELLKILEP